MSASPTPWTLGAEGEMNDTDARLWHPWLRINRVLRVMGHTRWSGDGGPHHLKIGLAAGHDGSVLSCLGVQFHVAAYPQREEWREHVHSTGVRTQPGPLARRPNRDIDRGAVALVRRRYSQRWQDDLDFRTVRCPDVDPSAAEISE